MQQLSEKHVHSPNQFLLYNYYLYIRGAVSACEKELASLGFPKEYWPGLCNIKINHPNWVTFTS